MSLSKKQKYNGTIWIPIFKETGLQNLDIVNDKFKLKEMFIKYFYENLKTYS